LRLFQGANKYQIIGAVGFGKQRPGHPEDSSIPEVQIVIDRCWKENPTERMTPLNLLNILNGSEAVAVKEENRGGENQRKTRKNTISLSRKNKTMRMKMRMGQSQA